MRADAGCVDAPFTPCTTPSACCSGDCRINTCAPVGERCEAARTITLQRDLNDTRQFRGSLTDAFTNSTTDDVTSSCGAPLAADRVFRFYSSARGDLTARAVTTTGTPLPVSIRASCAGAEEVCGATSAGATVLSRQDGHAFITVEATSSGAQAFTLFVDYRILPPGDICETAFSNSGWGCTPPTPTANPGCATQYWWDRTSFAEYRQDSVPACGMPGADRTFAFDLYGEADVGITALSSAFLSLELFGPFTTSANKRCDATSLLSCQQNSSISAPLQKGGYLVRVTAYGRPSTDAGLEFRLQHSGYRYDRCTLPAARDLIPLDGGVGRVVGSTFGYDDDSRVRCTSSSDSDAFHPIQIGNGQRLRATVSSIRPETFDPALQLWAPAPNGCETSGKVALECSAGYSFQPAVIQTGPLDAGLYTLQVDGRFSGESGDYQLDVVVQ